MSSTTSLGSAIAIAAASSVARAFLIVAVGYFSVRYRPRNGLDDPIIPPNFVGILARSNYLLMLCPLFYSGIGKAVNPSVLAGLWPVIVGFFFVILTGIISASALSFLPGFRFLRRKRNRDSYECIRIAAALPNAIALPLLIFPSLCEYDFVHESFSLELETSSEVMIQKCTESANVMIFLCQFAFCIYLFCIGQKILLRTSPTICKEGLEETLEISLVLDDKVQENGRNIDFDTQENCTREEVAFDEENKEEVSEIVSQLNTQEKDESSSSLLTSSSSSRLSQSKFSTIFGKIGSWLKEVFGSAGSIAMILGLITGCIPWLPSALFASGGSFRFFGGALDALGQAATPVTLLVVGASLFDPKKEDTIEQIARESTNSGEEEVLGTETDSQLNKEDENKMSSSLNLGRCLSEEVMTHAWLGLSRLILTPAMVSASLIGLDCGVPGLFRNSPSGNGGFHIPHLYKMVMIIVSAAPSAMTIIVLLKAAAGKDSSINDRTRLIAMLYLPLYLLSTITVAFWSMVGLWISLPDEDGDYFCEAYLY